MSNSARAKERRSRRSRTTKHQRSTMASQPSGNVVNVRRAEAKSAPGGLSTLERRMQEMKGKLGG